MTEISRLQSEALSELLSKRLSKTAAGRRVLEKLMAGDAAGPAALEAYLRDELAEDESFVQQVDAVLGKGDGDITNVISDSQIDQIINVARLDALNLTQYRQFILFRDVKQLVTFLVIVLGVAAMVTGGSLYYRWERLQPEVLDGDFNVAIARFAEMTDDGPRSSRETLNFMGALCGFLSSEYRATDFGLDVQISHINMPVVTEDRQALALAEKTNANLVIFGLVDFRGDEGRFTPSFYVNDLPNANEVAGYNELGTPIHFEKSWDSEEELNFVLNQRASILVNFTRGLVYLAGNRLEGALYSFDEAVAASEELDPFGGQEVLYLMLAYTQRLLDDHDRALASLDRALELNPEYARAYVGRANNYVDLYRADPTNLALLDHAEANYDAALRSGDRPPGAYISEKVDIGLGTVLFERARLTGDRALLPDITAHYETVISRYETLKEDELGRLAGYAYFNLGLIHVLNGEIDEAAAAFEQVMELPTDGQLKEQAERRLTDLQQTGKALRPIHQPMWVSSSS